MTRDNKTKPDETAYLLRSPRNAERLHRAIQRVKRGQGRKMSIEELRQEVGMVAAPRKPR